MKPRCETRGEAARPAPLSTPPRRTSPSQSTHAPAVHTRAPILRIPGVDLVAVQGMRDAMAQTIGAEIGTEMSTWPDETPWGSWLGLAPQKESSGGKVRKRRTLTNRHRAAQAFRMAAPSVLRSHCAFGACDRRLKGRRGPAQALVAPAHKLARTVYHRLKHRGPSHDIGAAAYHQRFRERELQYLQKKAPTLGYTLSLA